MNEKKKQDGVRGTFWVNGKRYYVRAKSEAELYEKIAKKKAELEKGLVIKGGSTLVSVWAQEWLTTYKAGTVSASWYSSIQHYVKRITDEIGHLRLNQVQPVHIQKIMNQYQGLSKSSIAKQYDVIHGMFEQATINGMIARNPSSGIVMPKAKAKQERRSITDEERTAFLHVAAYHRGGIFFKWIYYCGLRPQEVAALQWENVNLAGRSVKITQALKKDGTIEAPKTDAGYRTIPIPEVFAAELHRNIGYVCPRQSGKHHTETSIRDMWRSFKREMDLYMGAETYRNKIVKSVVADDLTPYCLRHTYCTDLQDAGVPINVAKELMGHSNISVTAKIYTHFTKASYENASSLIDSYQSSVSKSVSQS